MIRVAIIAPAIAVRAGLRALLGEEGDIQVIADAGSLIDMEESQAEPDVVIWSPGSLVEGDAIMPAMSKLNIRDTAALLLIHDDPKVIPTLTELPVSAWGMLDPEATQAELIAAVRALNEGLVVTDPAWINQELNTQDIKREMESDLVETLTGREQEVLQLMAVGLTNKQIAVRLKISAHTVKFHISTIFNKLGTTNRVESVNVGLKKGLIVL